MAPKRGLWDDIDKAPREHILMSAQLRRRQMLGDGLQLTFDLDHWNRVNSQKEPIQVVLDFRDDIDEHKHFVLDDKGAAS